MNKPYIIAETAYGFEGDASYLMELTKQLPDEIDAIKYHMLFDINEYMESKHSVYSLLESWIISEESWMQILVKAKEKGHDVIILADDIQTILFLEKNKMLVDGVEVHAACINDKNLLNKAINFVNETNKTLYLGISGFEIVELFDILEYIRERITSKVILMYGFQNYPTKIENVQLNKIPKLKDMLGFEVGYADHTEYNDPMKEQMIKTAYILGASVQEVHYTLSEGEKRTDNVTAVSSKGLLNIKQALRTINMAVGQCDLRLNEGELAYLTFRKVLVYSKNLQKGTKIANEDMKYIRKEHPSYQHKFSEERLYIGKVLINDVYENAEVKSTDFEIL